MRRFSACLVAVATISSSSLHAADRAVQMRYTSTYTACLNSSDGMTTYGMQACGNAEYVVQDARLNQAYKMVMARQRPSGKIRLRVLQRSWIERRDSRCATERAEWDGGSGAGFAWRSCMIDQTIERTIWLENYR